MADHHLHRHQQHRPNRISLPSRTTIPTTPTTVTTPTTTYPHFPYPPTTPTPTPSKHRLTLKSSAAAKPTTTSSVSFLLLLLFSLRSLYSLYPFLRSSPSSFSIFPFAFLVSLLSFLLSFTFSIFTAPSSSFSKDPFHQKLHQPIFSLSSISGSQLKILASKSALLAVVFLLRFQALLYCGTAAMILAELSGNVAARFMTAGRNRSFNSMERIGSGKIRGFICLLMGLFMLSISWDRIECFPLSSINVGKSGVSMLPGENCVRIWQMLLPFFSGFLGCYERVSMNVGSIRELGQKRVRLVTLFFTTVVLFIPAAVSMLVFEAEGDSISIVNLGWPLANTVVFGVLLSENCSDEKISSTNDYQKEYLVTFLCTLVLELFYYPELSLWGLLICGLLLWIAARELDPIYSDYVQLGYESSGSFSATVMKPIRHILSERKSRKIALFLLINTAYMVVEFVAGFMSNSLGLISDACHMLFDCAALAIGLYASYISRLPENSQFNYGRGRFEVLSGYVNAVFLVLVGALIVLESLERILEPQEISTSSLLTVSIGGLLVNVVGLIFFHEEHHHAHGGSGSCSHSHSHSHSHSDHHHHHHDKVIEHQECSSVVEGGHEIHQCNGDHEHHDHNNHPKSVTGVCHGDKLVDCHDHDHQVNHHDHHNHGHQHEHQDHNSHVHHDHHDHHNHGHQHNHQEQNSQVHQLNHHDHADHLHPHADNHVHQHDHDHHLHHRHVDHHAHGIISEDSSSQMHDHSLESHKANPGNDSHNHGHTELVLEGKEPLKHHQQHRHIDHNMEGIFLHVLADTMGSVGVVISTLLIKYKGWLVADPACSIFISVLIVASVIPLLRNSAEVLLQRVPRAHEHDLDEALQDIMKMKGVCGIQNLHVWSLTNTDVVGTLHLHVSSETDKASVKARVSHLLNDAGIKDLTVQVECIKSS